MEKLENKGMKNIFIIILLFFTTGLFAQKLTIKQIEIYGVTWNTYSRIAFTVKDIEERSQYHLLLGYSFALCFEGLFHDYESCEKLLMSQDTIPFRKYPPSDIDKDCIACVKLYFTFDSNIITIYFRANGEYYFQGKYYEPNKELYSCVFSFLAKDRVMPNELIDKEIKRFMKKFRLDKR